MLITLRPKDSLVDVDGVSRSIAFHDLPAEITAVSFDTLAGAGRVELDAATGREGYAISSFIAYQAYFDRWREAAPPQATPAPTPEQIKASDLASKRAAALKVLDDARLAEAALDPLAPQEVKDYDAALKP